MSREIVAAETDYTDEVSTFGDRLTAAREAMGLDPEELARRMGVELDTARAWEEDRSEPRANKLQMLAGVLNVSVIWLMSGQGTGPRAVPADEDEVAAEIGTILEEVRAIRTAQQQLAGQLQRLERRLVALLP